MLDLLFGAHIGGWQAWFQFWFWTGVLFGVLLFWWKRGK